MKKEVAIALTKSEYLHPDLMVFIHSMNKSGAERIAEVLKNAGIKFMLTPITEFIK